jgi:hypothetical protein
MTDNTPLPFDLPSVCRKKLTVDFDGGNQSSDGGLLLLRQAERKLGVPATCRCDAGSPRSGPHPARDVRDGDGASQRSPADTRMPLISIGCGTIRS